MRTFPKHLTLLVSVLKQFQPKDHGMISTIARGDVCDRMTKKSRSDKTPPPEWSLGLHSVTRSVMASKPAEGNYTTAVQNQQAKAGFAKDFVAQASKISQPIEGFPNGLLREGLKNPDQLYVRFYIDVFPTKMEQYYFNEKGENVTHLVTTEFKDNFFPKKYGSVTQAMAGVAKEIKPREYKAENIIYLQRGEHCFNNLSDNLMTLFKLKIS